MKNYFIKLILLFCVSCIAYNTTATSYFNKNFKLTKDNKYILPDLPYNYDALEPYIDAETMKIHHDKHHQAYIDNLNNALKDHPKYLSLPVQKLLVSIDELPKKIRTVVKNNAGGHLNHSMFWLMMAPKTTKSYSEPKDKLKEAIDKNFGSFDKFKEQFNQTAKKVFGSGWAWLCVDKDKNLIIVSTKDQDNPISNNLTPILGLDVWEHAYYLKYQNKRLDYITAWWNVVNWPHIEQNYQKAIQ